MSGTSLDGLDIAACQFWCTDNKWSYALCEASTVTFPKELYQRLKCAPDLAGEELSLLDVELGRWMGESVHEFMTSPQLEVDLIASHGYTVFHQPEKNHTLQIGNGHAIHQACGIPVIFDFRSMDVALGGQGAPLVPIGDELLFTEFDYCLNIGGIANLSTQLNSRRIAYDIVPANMVLNHCARRKGLEYDSGGQMAFEGDVIESVLCALEGLDYFKASFPKSLGFEWVKKQVLDLQIFGELDPSDQLATFGEHIGRRIGHEVLTLNRAKSSVSTQKMLVTGGGAYNKYILDRIKSHLPENVNVVLPGKDVIEFKEALIFAFLGVLKIDDQINCLSSVTGASADSSGGLIAGSIKHLQM